LKGECVGFGALTISSDEVLQAKSGIVASVERVVMERGLYPKMWAR